MPMTIQGVEFEFFTPSEFENVHEMNFGLLCALEALRRYINHPIRIHESNPAPGVGGVHVPNSRHYVGRAVDCSCRQIPLWDFFLAATRFPEFTGIGIYPYWHAPGLHLEIEEGTARRKYWWRDEQSRYRSPVVQDLREIFLTSRDDI